MLKAWIKGHALKIVERVDEGRRETKNYIEVDQWAV
jgi:hypothetical protein